MHKKLTLVSLAAAGVLAAIGSAAPAYGQGAKFPNSNASCMGWLAEAANPNASGDHIALIAQSGDASTVAHGDVAGSGFHGLLSCVAQIP